MRLLRIYAVVMTVMLGAGSNARFSVAGTASTSSVIVATTQPRTGAPGYSWLRIYFYPSTLSTDDKAAATTGRVASIKAKWSAVLQLTVDKDLKVWQVDLSLPGHTCTIAESDRDAKNLLQELQLSGKRVRLKSKGSHVCDLKSLGMPKETYEWDVDLDIPVVGNAS
jgi:hypothetical protein